MVQATDVSDSTTFTLRALGREEHNGLKSASNIIFYLIRGDEEEGTVLGEAKSNKSFFFFGGQLWPLTPT